jgi:hypothetical protein
MAVRRIQGKALLTLAVTWALLTPPTLLADGISSLTAQIKKDTEWYASYTTRVVGTSEHDRAIDDLLRKIGEIPGVTVWTHQFSVVVPRTKEASLTVPGHEPFSVYPVWPATMRLDTTPTEGISGKLVYVREGKPEQLLPRSLKGQIGVMEITGRSNWQTVYNMGATAVILLGSPDESQLDLENHIMRVPIHIPRFYVPPGPLADALRKGEFNEGKLDCRAAWEKVEATNIYAAIKTSNPADPKKALAIGVPIDSMSVVPELSPGADNAVDVGLALNLLRYYAQYPPSRPLLVTFFDAYGINQLGVREMLGALAATPNDRRHYFAEDQKRIEEYQAHKQLADEIGAEREALQKLSDGRYKELHSYIKDEVSRKIVTIETKLEARRLKFYTVPEDQKAELRNRINELALERTHIRTAQMELLSKGVISDDIFPLAQSLWQAAHDRISEQFADVKRAVALHDLRDAQRRRALEALGLAGREERPIDFLLGLDLSDAGVAAGPLLYCRFGGNDLSGSASALADARDFTAWLKSEHAPDEGERVWSAEQEPAVNLAPMASRDAPFSYIVGDLASITFAAGSFGVPAVTWSTLDAFRERLDTPMDTADRLNWSRLAPQVEATIVLVHRMISDPEFKLTTKIVPRWIRIKGKIVDQSPGEPVARLPMKGYLTTLTYGESSGNVVTLRPMNRYSASTIPGIRRDECLFTGADGEFMFDLWPVAHARYEMKEVSVQSYLLDEAGRITRAVDLSKAIKGSLRYVRDIRSRVIKPMRAIVFSCKELTVCELFDPRFLMNLPLGWILDAQRGNRPQRMNSTIYQGMMSCQLDPDIRWELLLRAGATHNRMVLLNARDPDQLKGLSTREMMRGFGLTERLPFTPMHMSALDFYNLDQQRIESYRDAGITSEAIDKIHQGTKKLLNEAETALNEDDGARLFRAAAAALSNEVRAYQAVRDTANDVVRAAVFLLLVLVPFSFAMERLLSASPNVYRQILGMMIIFAVMTAVLWSFHPAFRISNQPLMIIMAFGILAMSLLVISMIYSRFSTELKEIRSGRAESSGARTSRSGVLSTAIWLGIANMRKRKLRTALTGTTICLITFALLCFTSASTYVGLKEYRLSNEVPFKGILIRQPGKRPMPEQTLAYVRSIVGAGKTIIPRYWWCDQWTAEDAKLKWQIHVRSETTGRQIALSGAVCLSPEEANVSRIDRVLPDWARFAEKGGCYLAAITAEQLGVKPGDSVIIAGRSLELIGVFDSSRGNTELKDLDRTQFMPFNYAALAVDDTQRNLMNVEDENSLQNVVADMSSGMDRDLPYLSSDQVVILPADMLKGLRTWTLRSILIEATSDDEIRELTQELAKQFAFPIFYGTSDGVHIVTSTPLLPKAPKSLFIPLVIAGLIIFNTMLNSVAERKKEIYVYTSLGLAPVHVGVLFLAEAATYGLMGSTFGYVVGQGVATLFSSLGWLGDITLNYSGTQAIVTMALVLAVVILSSLVPAFTAGKLATPSEDMKWRVPFPENGLIKDRLPFTATVHTASGVMAFLREYLQAHGAGGIGCFTTDNLKTFRTLINGFDVMGVEATVWLEPYDLGVRQDVRLSVCRTSDDDVYEFVVELKRGSGQESSWWRLNKVFLGDLRKQLLGWRSLKTERVLRYIDEAAELLKESQD